MDKVLGNFIEVFDKVKNKELKNHGVSVSLSVRLYFVRY